MTSNPVEYGSPWYKNFWPWFIVLLLGISVVGSLVTVGIAYRHRDIDVRTNTSVESATPTGLEVRE